MQTAYVIRGQALFLQGEFDDAGKMLKEALRLAPDTAEAKTAFKRARTVGRAVGAASGGYSPGCSDGGGRDGGSRSPSGRR